MDLNLATRDEKFVKTARIFILNLRKVGEIEPIRRAWIPRGFRLVGFAVGMDGDKLGSGCLVHCLAGSSGGTDEPLDRTVCISKSKIGKRNIPAHEAMAAPLASDALATVLDSLKYDFADYPMEIHFLSDSTCFLSMLNPIIELKNTLFQNCVNSFKERIMTINAQFSNVRISIGYVSTDQNPADTVTKMLVDPVPIMNSKLYREGPMKYDSLKTLRQDTVARVSEDGEFIFLGIPERFLPPDPGGSKCMKCQDNCWMVRTRSQNRKNIEDKNLATKNREKDELDLSPNSTQSFFRRVSYRLVAITQSGHLLNPHEPLKSCLVLDKKNI